MRLCIVSPHLDDAILSCGIRIQRVVAAGDSVFILNIFNAGTNAENRKAEELAAAKALGATPFFLDELDAPDRNPVYKSDVQIFFGDFTAVPADFITHIASRVAKFLDAQDIDVALFPLGAGGHIDHRITHAAGRRLNGQGVRFYEDRPYSLWPGILSGRMNRLGAAVALPQADAALMQEMLGQFDHLKYFVPEGSYRDATLPLYFADAAHVSENTLRATGEEIIATDAEVEKLYAALCLYESQVPLFHPTFAGFVADNARYEGFNSGRSVYAERSWTLVKRGP